MPAALIPILMTLVFGAPSFAAMTPLLWAGFALNVATSLPKTIKTTEQIIAFLESPAGRQMLAANGAAAIRWQNKQMEF